jgi:hypothetical protein
MDEKGLRGILNVLSLVLVVLLTCDFAWVIRTALHAE